MSERKNYTRIEGVSDQVELPRVGKIRLGAPKGERNAGKDLPHFRFDEEDLEKFPALRPIASSKPTELDAMLPVESQDVWFPQAMRLYGADQRLKCIGNLRTARRYACAKCGQMICRQNCKHPFVWTDRECPCELADPPKRACRLVARLYVFLPQITLAGCWMIQTTNRDSIRQVQSGAALVRGMIGRVSMVPLKLGRISRPTQVDGKMMPHWPLTLAYAGDLDAAQRVRAALGGGGGGARLIAPPDADDEPPDDLPIETESGDLVDPKTGEVLGMQNAEKPDERPGADTAEAETVLLDEDGKPLRANQPPSAALGPGAARAAPRQAELPDTIGGPTREQKAALGVMQARLHLSPAAWQKILFPFGAERVGDLDPGRVTVLLTQLGQREKDVDEINHLMAVDKLSGKNFDTCAAAAGIEDPGAWLSASNEQIREFGVACQGAAVMNGNGAGKTTGENH